MINPAEPRRRRTSGVVKRIRPPVYATSTDGKAEKRKRCPEDTRFSVC